MNMFNGMRCARWVNSLLRQGDLFCIVACYPSTSRNKKYSNTKARSSVEQCCMFIVTHNRNSKDQKIEVIVKQLQLIRMIGHSYRCKTL